MFSIRDIYPNLTSVMSTKEETIPEREELIHYAARAEVDTDKTEVKKPTDIFTYIIWILVGLFILTVMEIIDIPFVEGI
jgi:hypothetical protein